MEKSFFWTTTFLVSYQPSGTLSPSSVLCFHQILGFTETRNILHFVFYVITSNILYGSFKYYMMFSSHKKRKREMIFTGLEVTQIHQVLSAFRRWSAQCMRAAFQSHKKHSKPTDSWCLIPFSWHDACYCSYCSFFRSGRLIWNKDEDEFSALFLRNEDNCSHVSFFWKRDENIVFGWSAIKRWQLFWMKVEKNCSHCSSYRGKQLLSCSSQIWRWLFGRKDEDYCSECHLNHTISQSQSPLSYKR